jgi:hypothetical protein
MVAPLPSLCSICVGGAFEGKHERHAQLGWTVARIIFWMAVAGLMHWRRWYWAL